jgi:hypothetical protein
MLLSVFLLVTGVEGGTLLSSPRVSIFLRVFSKLPPTLISNSRIIEYSTHLRTESRNGPPSL